MGEPGDMVGSVEARDSPSCGGIEAAEGAVTRERNSIPLAMTFSDLDMILNPVQCLLQILFKFPNF